MPKSQGKWLKKVEKLLFSQWSKFMCLYAVVRPFHYFWLVRLAAITEVATVLGSIPASYDRVESEERQIKQC